MNDSAPIRKVLIVGESRHAWYAPAWKEALCHLGIEAAQFSYTDLWSPGLAGRFERRLMWGPALALINRQVMAAAQELQPDVILLYAAFPVWPATVKALAKRSWIATYHNDDPFGAFGRRAYFRHFHRSLPLAHSHHAYRDVNVEDYHRRGYSRVGLLRSYYIPWLDCPPDLTDQNRTVFGHEVVFVGHPERDRRLAYVQAMVRAGLPLKVYGPDGRHGWGDHLPPEVYERLDHSGPIYGMDYRKVLAASKISLGFFSGGNRDQYTRRVFEIPAVGGFLLCERTPVMQALYAEDHEAVYFSSAEELVEKCRFYLAHGEARQRIARAGQERCLGSGYDVISRMRQWLADTGQWMEEASTVRTNGVRPIFTSPPAPLSTSSEGVQSDILPSAFTERRTGHEVRGGFHLAVDAVGTKHSGGATVLLDFLAAALADERIGRISLFCSPRAARNFDLPTSPKIVELEIAPAERSYLYRMAWYEWLLGRKARRIGAGLLLCMNGMGRGGANMPHVTYMQQSLPFSPEALARFGLPFRVRMLTVREMMRRSCGMSARVLAQTPTMRAQIVATFGIDPEKIAVFMPPTRPLPRANGISPAVAPMLATREDRRLLYVGSDAPHKNVEVAIRGMKRILQAVPGARLFVTWPPDHPLCQEEGVIGLGYLSKSDLRLAYERATLVILPSLVESAPLPIPEAMLAGKPVLAADRPYAHDMAGEAAVYFDPLDPRDFADNAILLLWNEAKLRDLIGRGSALMARRLEENSYREMVDALIQIMTAYRYDLKGEACLAPTSIMPSTGDTPCA